ILPPKAAKTFLHNPNIIMALHAKFKFETDVFFMILLRNIMKNTSVSK
ncbi:MAG: hypothetical protein RL386_1046, partial [Bacteroidota bacterium]